MDILKKKLLYSKIENSSFFIGKNNLSIEFLLIKTNRKVK